MPKPKTFERIIECVGRDSEFMYFQTESWSGTGEVYEIIWSIHEHTVTCSCMDASCRQKTWYVLGKEGQNICKHVRRLRETILPAISGTDWFKQKQSKQ